MEILRKVPPIIKEEPIVTQNKDGVRFAVIDFIMYILDDNITEKKLRISWIRTTRKKNKTLLVKSRKETYSTKIKLVNNYYFQCECENFKLYNDCIHVRKIKKYFLKI